MAQVERSVAAGDVVVEHGDELGDDGIAAQGGGEFAVDVDGGDGGDWGARIGRIRALYDCEGYTIQG